MNMPARQFFAMTKAAEKLLALERLEECDIAAIPACKPDYHKNLKQGFLGKVIEIPQPHNPKRVAISAASEEAQYALSSLMANLKRSVH